MHRKIGISSQTEAVGELFEACLTGLEQKCCFLASYTSLQLVYRGIELGDDAHDNFANCALAYTDKSARNCIHLTLLGNGFGVSFLVGSFWSEVCCAKNSTQITK